MNGMVWTRLLAVKQTPWVSGSRLSAKTNTDITLGTKLHQHTRKVIAKRQLALLNAISRYNKFCVVLKETRSLECSIPVPKPLPTSLQELWSEMSDLMEDVVIAPHKEGHIHWLEDTNARIGIRAMLKPALY